MDDIVVWGGNVYGNWGWGVDVWKDVSRTGIQFRIQMGKNDTFNALDFDNIYYA